MVLHVRLQSGDRSVCNAAATFGREGVGQARKQLALELPAGSLESKEVQILSVG